MNSIWLELIALTSIGVLTGLCIAYLFRLDLVVAGVLTVVLTAGGIALRWNDWRSGGGGY